MYLFAKLIIVGVWFTGVLTLRLAVAFFIFPNTFFVRWVFQHLFMMTQNSVLLTFFSDVWASCFQVFSPDRNCSAVPVTSGFFFFFYHIHTYFQLCTDANGGISSVFHTFHGFPGVTWEVLCFLEPRSFHGCALCRGRVFRQLEHLRAAGRLHETQAACGAFTYPSSFTVVMQSSPFKAFTHRLLLAVNASAEMFVPYF